MLLVAFGVCGCLALPLAMFKIIDISSDKEDLKKTKEDKRRINVHNP